MSVELLAVTGRATGVRWTLEAKTSIGRSSSATIQLLDDAVGRHHAEIVAVSGGFVLRDLGSQNGTTINGLRVEGERTLVPRDVIGIGATTFLFAPDIDYVLSDEGPDLIIAAANVDADREIEIVERTRTEEPTESSLLAMFAEELAKPRARAHDLLRHFLGLIAERFSAERAFVLAKPEQKTTRPRVLAAVGEGVVTVSRTVVFRVLEERRAIVSGDAPKDVAFAGGVSLLSSDIRSLLAAPLVANGRVLGMVHLDRRNRGAYGPRDLELLLPVANLLALVLLASEGADNLRRRARGDHRVERPSMIVESEVMKALVKDVVRAASSNASVLFTGESGTGKEVLARLLHVESTRAEGPFVAVNCAALPATLQESELFGHEQGAFTGADRTKIGLFEAANGGTLFLDEIGECALTTQVKLLRALQERVIYRLGSTRPLEVDVRIVAATSRRTEEMIAKNEMREDLYFRLAVIHLRVPPLRTRTGDVRVLATAFARQLAEEAGVPPKTIDEDALEALERLSWPGNVRELRNAIERVVILSESATIGLADFPAELLAGGDVARRAIAEGETLANAVARVEREMITRSIARTGGVKSAVADALGISRVTLDAKLKVHGITWPKRG